LAADLGAVGILDGVSGRKIGMPPVAAAFFIKKVG